MSNEQDAAPLNAALHDTGLHDTGWHDTGWHDTARPGTAVLPFRDPALPLADRIEDLLRRLTDAEKIAMLHQYAPAVPRLGIAAFRTGTEVLHGVAWLGVATVFPQAVGLGATWDPTLVSQVAAAAATELRAFHERDPRVSLNAWAPVVNLLRDPRWGRNEEGYSEDPVLTTRLAIAFCRGITGDDPTYLRAAPALKHFLAYNNENDRAQTSSSLRPRVLHEYDLQAFADTVESGAAWGMMPAYNLVNGRPCHVSPLLRSQLRRWAAQAGHELVVFSDAVAPSNLVDAQHYFDDHAVATAAALRAGVDSFTDHGDQPEIIISRVNEALKRGLVYMRDVDRAVRRLLTLRFRVGEFDRELDPYAGMPPDVVDCAAHRDLARRAAQASIVLLHNNFDTLPLHGRKGDRIAVVGPSSDTLFEDWCSGTMPYQVTPLTGIREQAESRGISVAWAEGVDRIALRATSATGCLGVSSSDPFGALGIGELDDEHREFDVFEWGEQVITLRSALTRRYVTVLDDDLALAATARQPSGWEVHETFRLEPDGDAFLLCAVLGGRYVTVDAATGEARASTTDKQQAERWHLELLRDGLQQAVDAARDADDTIVVVGNDPHINGRETQDRTSIALPARHDKLLRAVAAACPRTALVVMSSYPFALDWAAVHVPAALWTCHAGQETGRALASVLFGDADPGGRLPQTWYRGDTQLPDPLDYDIIKAGWTYQYFRGDPLYSFGHGLSYTRFVHRGLTLSTTAVAADGAVVVGFEVANVGSRPGVEVVQLYSRALDPRYDAPRLRLQDFQSVELGPGECRPVEFVVEAAALGHWDVESEKFTTDPGRYQLLLGSSASAITVTAQLIVGGPCPGPRQLAGRRFAAARFDDCVDARLVDLSKEAGDAVTPAPGAALCSLVFRRADLGDDCSGVVIVEAAREEPGVAWVELRADDPVSGPLLARVPVASTGDRYNYAEFTAPLTGGGGVRDLYVLLRGEQRVARLLISRAG